MREEGAGNIIAALGRMEGPNATGAVAQPILVMGQSQEPAAVPNCSRRWLVLWGCLPGPGSGKGKRDAFVFMLCTWLGFCGEHWRQRTHPSPGLLRQN